jgi:uncharacterized protein YjeT (DUF2065 family)
MVASIVFLTLAVLLLVEGVLIALFPKQVREMLKRAVKSKKIAQIGVVEAMVGILLLMIGLVLL